MEWKHAESTFSEQTLDQIDWRYELYIAGGLSRAKLRSCSVYMLVSLATSICSRFKA